jgi:hypothetical protein
MTSGLAEDPHAAERVLDQVLWRRVVPEENSSVVVTKLFLCVQPGKRERERANFTPAANVNIPCEYYSSKQFGNCLFIN